jgi:hypothetical protein
MRILGVALALGLAGGWAPAAKAGALRGTVVAVFEKSFILQTSTGLKPLKVTERLVKGEPCDPSKDPVSELFYPLKLADLKEGRYVSIEYRRVGADWVCVGIKPTEAEIDFDRLPSKDAPKFTVVLTLVTEDGTKLERKYEFEAGTTPVAVRDRILISLMGPPVPKDRWECRPKQKAWLAVTGYLRDDKYSMIKRVEVRCPELKPGEQPRVRQWGQSWPEE